MNPQYTNVKVEGPSFPTKGQLENWKDYLRNVKGFLRGSFLRIVFQELGEGMFQKSWRNCLRFILRIVGWAWDVQRCYYYSKLISLSIPRHRDAWMILDV